MVPWVWLRLLPEILPWTRPVTDLPGIGPARANMLHRMGLSTVGDVLLHLPRAYHRFVPYAHLRDVVALADGEGVIVQGQAVSPKVQRTKSRRHIAIESVTVTDGTAKIQVRWFVPFRGPVPRPRLASGQQVTLRGVLATYGSTRLLTNAEICEPPFPDAEQVVPIYPLTQGITQKLMQTLVRAALKRGMVPGTDDLPATTLPSAESIDDTDVLRALHLLHAPKTLNQAEVGRRILALRELHLLAQQNRSLQSGPRVGNPWPDEDGELLQNFYRALPFRPTHAQIRAMGEIRSDMAQELGMRRVLCGDVGSGKSLVIAYALLKGVEAGGQSLLIAPTRILAAQHVATLTRLFAGLNIRIGHLSAELSVAERTELLSQVREGTIDILVSTHAALEPSAQYKRLLVGVIDEQHRFGVAQRKALDEKRPTHALWVSATPIPKTMGEIIYGGVPISYLDERPPGRTEVDTRWVSNRKRQDVYRFVDKEIRNGGRAFVVCPAIEEDQELGIPGAEQVWQELARMKPGGYPVAVIHGRLDPEAQERALEEFVQGRVRTLVATSMVEVGVDVPEATVMVVEGADRFGLSQLHQLRGRVGRGTRQSYAILVSDAPTQQSKERLSAIRTLHDGFQLAEADLVLRGPGEFAGTRQSGVSDLRFADFARDIDLFRMVMGT